jgi:hypothetical protein
MFLSNLGTSWGASTCIPISVNQLLMLSVC